MIIRMPDYYKQFHCIADRCQHTCCAGGWEIGVDDQTYDDYCEVGGEFGKRLMRSIKKDDHPHFLMKHGKCPFLGKDHLCEIYKQLGEESLGTVCTEYPRFDVEYEETREKSLSLSCEEVGRLLFSRKDKITFLEQELKGTEPFAHHKNTEAIVKARDYCISLLQDRKSNLKTRLLSILEFGVSVQNLLNDNGFDKVDQAITEHAKKEIIHTRKLANKERHALFQKRMDLMMEMEVMEEEWIQQMNNVMRAFYSSDQYERTSAMFSEYMDGREHEYEHLLVYFIYRYLVKAVEDDEFLNRLKFCVVCYLTIRDMDRMRFLIQGMSFTMEDRIDTARIFSKQVEHSQKSMEYLLEKVANEEVFLTEALASQL